MPGSFRDSPAPRLWYGGCVATSISVATGRDPPMFRGSGLHLGRRRDGGIAPYRFGHAGRVTLPWFRPGGRYSVPLLAAQSRHKKPYLPMSKINFRPAFERQDGDSISHSPHPTQAGFLERLKLLTCQSKCP